jgi:hypothetical protein
MLDRRARAIGVRLVETAFAKHALDQIAAPSLPALKAMKTHELKGPTQTASAVVPKVLSTTST